MEGRKCFIETLVFSYYLTNLNIIKHYGRKEMFDSNH